jgi:hypothetical protein
MRREILLLKELSANKSFEGMPLFRETIMTIKDHPLDDDDVDFLVHLYILLKDIPCRSFILQTLVLKDNGKLHDFFFNAFSRERHLDMKLTAIRGYANYATENEVEILMSKFTATLKRGALTTPYNYEEYELIRSVFGLPYLIEKYKYKCFFCAYEQEEELYKAMPEAFKGYFTLDEKGNLVELLNSNEIKKKMEDFFSSSRKNQ